MEKTNLPKSLLIKQEKRRRLQVYNTLDYMINVTTFMDFYSKDLIKIISHSQLWSELISKFEPESKDDLKNKKIKSDAFLYSYILTSSTLKNTLLQHGLTKEIPRNILENLELSFKKRNIFAYSYLKVLTKIKSLKKNSVKSKSKISSLLEDPEFSTEVMDLFEKSVVNAITRFKTPVITPEIFFITLMEENTCLASTVIKEYISEEMDWYTLRYKLIKMIHFQESHMRNDISKNQKYFGYLLKAGLTQLEFERLIDLGLLGLAVEYFRNKLFRLALEQDVYDCLKIDIYNCAHFHNRKYLLA